jgi:competence protein ComEC
LRRPLVGCALLFLAGLLAGIRLLPPFIPVFAVTAVCVAFALMIWRHFHAQVFLVAALFGTGMLSGILGGSDVRPSALGNLLDYNRSYLNVDGIIQDDPVYSASEKGMSCSFELSLRGILLETGWQRASGRLAVTADGVSSGELEYGQRLRAEGLLKLTPSGGWSRHDGWFYTEGGHLVRLESSPWSLRALCYRGRRYCAQILAYGPGPQALTTRLLKALLLGYREDISYEMREIFSTTGTFHIFAISGLHVGIVTLLLIGLLKIFGVPRNRWVFWLIPLLIIYTLSTGARASAVRACIMAILFWSAAFWRRRPDSLSALSATALLILAVAPRQIMEPGFIMSFAVVTGIILMYPRLFGLFRGLLDPDPVRIQREPLAVRMLRRTAVYLTGLFCVSVAAWLASMPLTAGYFNVFCPVSLLGNMVVVPGALVVVYTGCLSLLTGLLFQTPAEIFNYANAFFVQMLLVVVQWMRDVPGGHWFVQSPPVWSAAIWYGLLFMLFARKRMVRRAGIAVAAVLLGTGAVVYFSETQIEIDVLDVGEGNAALVNLPRERDDMLIDVGPSHRASRVLRHLRQRGVDRLGVLVLTHPDPDHIGAAAELLEHLPVREVWGPDPALFSDTLRQSWPVRQYEELLRTAEAGGSRIRFAYAGEVDFPAGVQRDVFWPPADLRSHTPSDASLVLRIARDGCAVLFAGGARRRVEGRILESGQNSAAPILVAGDHGSRGTCSRDWLDFIRPELTILSVGFYNAHGNPAGDVLKRLEESGSDVWRTDRQRGLRITWEAGSKYPFYRTEPLDE